MITEVTVIWVSVDTPTKSKEVLYHIDALSNEEAEEKVRQVAMNSPMAADHDILDCFVSKRTHDPKTNFIINVDTST